jgi:hypothetical protein
MQRRNRRTESQIMATALSDKAIEPWSKMDIVDLQSGLAFGTSIEAIADFLTRDVEEVREKAASLPDET